MGRSAIISPLGLYQWDSTLFELMVIPTGLNRDTLIDNLLAETSELEVLYPNPVVLKNLIGVWSHKNIDVWNRLYSTTQYEYNPIENYNRYEEGSEDGTGSTTHSGTDSHTDTTTHSGSDGRTEALTQGGRDTATRQNTEGGSQTQTLQSAQGGTEGEQTSVQMTQGGTEGEQTTAQVAQGGTDTVTGQDTKGHWIAGFNSSGSGQNDGLVKQTRDEDNNTNTTAYGKTESDTGSKTTTFGKTENDTGSKTTTFGKTESGSETTTFGKTNNESDTTNYGKTENVTEQRTYGQSIANTGSITHGEQIRTVNEGSHILHAHGNIGVTSTQQMIREQRDIERFNLYDIIIEDFKTRFCIMIY